MKKFIQLILLVAFGSYLHGQNTVTFQVDMNDYSGSFTTVYVSGDFNGWSGNANAMSDPNMDGVWEVSLPLTNDSIEFKYTLDNWAGQENLTAGSTCTKTSFGFTNRFLVITGNVTLPVSCFESCGACTGVSLNIVDFPITWDDATVNYARTSFGGQSDSLKVDPTDATNMVVKLDKGPGAATWSGTTLTTGGLANPIPFSSGGANTISVRFWSPDANTPVLLKVEDKTNGAIFVEAMDTTTVAGGWEYLAFDYNNPAPNALAINFANTYDLISLFPNFGTDGNTAGAKTYYVDDVIYGTVAVAGPLNGVYTIDPSLAASTTNYTSFSAAAADLVALGVSGPVTFNIAPGSYTDTVYLPAIMGTSATNTILFDGGDSATTTLSYNSAAVNQREVIMMDGADYVTIKGLTIKHDGTLDSWGIRMDNDNDNFTLESCRIEMLPTTSTSELTCLGSSNSATSQFGETEAGDNITINLCSFVNGTYGVHFESTSTFGDSNIVVTNNTFENNYYRYYMSDNTYMITLNGNTASGMAYSFGYGFAIYDCIGFEINNNFITGPDWGIYISDGNFNGDGVPPSTSHITNNMVISANDEALYCDDVEMVNIYYNSFVVAGSTSTSAYGAYFNDFYNMEIKNNVFYSEAAYAVYFSDNTATAGTTSGVITVDHNAYHTVSGSNLAYDAGAQSDLATWQANRAGNNVSSVSGDPIFINPASDLHVAGSLLNGAGTPITGFTTDIDGDTRDAVNPDLGADEFTPASCLPVSSFTTISSFADSARVAWLDPNGSGTTFTIEYGPAGFTPGTGSLITAHPDTFVLITGLTSSTDYEYYVTADCGAGGVASQAGPGAFRTACATFVAPYLESFTGIALGHLPEYTNCWTNPSSTTPRWESEDATGANENSLNTGPFYDATTPSSGGGYYMYLETSFGLTGASSELVSPYIDHSALTAPELSFYYHMYGATINKLLIYAEDGMGVRTLLDSIVGQQQAAGSDPFLRHGINISSLPGSIYKYIFVAYRGSSFTGDISIDDVAVDQAPSCSAPTAAMVDSVNSSEAFIHWTTGGASNWIVEYGAAGFTLGSGTQIIASNDSITITGLSPNTAYEFYVADSCGVGDVSSYAGPIAFNTTAFCPGTESLPYAENFDAGIGCFTAIDAGGSSGDTWAHTVNGGQNLDGTGYMRVDSDANGNGTHLVETLQSPVIDASTVSTSLILEFDHYYRALGDSATVQVYDGTNWVNVAVYKSSTGGWSSPSHEVIDVTAYANANFQVRFFYDDANTWAWYWNVDNFSVEDKCLTQSLPYVENFDTDQGCFTTTDGGAASGDTWMHTSGSSQNLDGTGYMRVDSDANGNGTYMREQMTSPVIDASGYAGTLMLEYDHYYRSIGSDTGWVDVWDGTAWVNVAMYTSSVGGWGAPSHEAIDISAYANANLQVRFDYDDGNTWAWYWSVDNFSVMDVGCLPPSALGAFNVTTNSADVFWTTGGASNWLVEYGPSGFTLGSGTRVMASNDTITLSGLQGATSYDFYVADSCGAADVSTWTGPFSFSTACPSSVPAPYFADFEGITLGNQTTFDNCWTTYGTTNPAWIADNNGTPSGGTGPSVDHTTGGSGIYMFLETSFPATLGDTNTLYSPAIDISTLTNAQVSFWYHMYGATMGNIYVYAMDATGTRTLLDSIIGQQQFAQNDPWLQKLVDASGLASGTYRFLIEGEMGSSFTSDMAIDDFAVEEAPACFASSGLQVVSAGNTSATVTWTVGTGTSWDVEYGPAGFMPGSGTVINSTNDTLTITGLMASTVYDFYVTDSCGGGIVASTAGPGTFTTSACALADQCSYVFDLYDTFGDGWNGGALKVYQNGVQVATVGNTFSSGSSSLGNLVSLCDNQPIVVTLDPAGAWPSEIGVVVIQPNGDTAGVHVASGSVGTGDTLFSFTSNCSSCATYAAPFFESFEVSSASIACWTNEAVSDTSLAWSLGAGSTGGSISAAYAGSLNAVYVSQGPSGAADTTRMVSPVLDLSSLISPQLSFWYAQEDWFGDQNITNVYYRASATDPWTYLWGDNTSKASWTLATMSLPNPSSTYQIAIEGINNWGHANVVDSLSITDAAVVCTMPDSVAASNITANSADISWVSSSNTSSSWIEYGPAGFAPGTGTIVSPATSATTISGLMPGTAYEACVYDICSALGDTSMASCVSFATLCAPITSYPYMEDFDNGLFPTCWSETTTGSSYTWRIDAGGTPSTNTGPAVDHTTGTGAGYYMYVEASSPAAAGDSAFLYTPEFNMTSLTNPEIVYYYHMFGVDIVNLDLQVYDRTAMTWNSINNIVGQQQTSNGDAWGEARVNLAAYTTDTALQFRFLSVRGASFDGDAAVDDVIIRETPACVDPANLMVVTATSSSVVLAWDSDTNIVASTVQYGAPGFALGTGTNVAATPGGFTVTGLAGTTCYDFYVKDSCTTGTNWIGPVSACTIATCSVSSMPSGTTNDTTDCDGGSTTLMATSSTGNDLVWTVNGVVRETGDTYVTDSVPFTTAFDVSEYVTTMPTLHVGPLTNIAASGFGNFSNGQWITVHDTIHIDSMTVLHQNDVVAFAQLWDASISNVLQRGDTFSTPAGVTGDFRVPVNMVVTPGVYFMNVDFLSGAGSLFRATGGAAYPYDLPGLMSIDSTNFSAQIRIYYTFDITVSKACIGAPAQALAVVPGANAGTTDTSLVCSTDMAANMAAYLGVHDNGGTWVDNDATGANTDSILDATMLTAGNIYHFSYIVPGVNGCAGDTANVYVEVEAAPFGGVDTSVAYCAGSGIKILRNLLTGTAFGGTWVDVDGSGALNTGTGVFNANNATAGTYRIEYILSGIACAADTTTITVTIDDPVSAGVAVTDTVCDDENMVDLNSFLDASASAGGMWTDLSGTGALSANIFDATAVANMSSYNFQYKVMSACGDDSVTVTLYVDDCDVSVRELSTGFINIYPNPTSGVIKIDDENVRGAIKVEVFAGNGQLMISEEYAEGEEIRLDISEYAVGIYTVKVNSSKGLDVKRIMKQ